MQIKTQPGKLTLAKPLKDLISLQQEINNLQILQISQSHVMALENLPPHHRDPFGRLLLVQAQEEKLRLVGKDSVFSHYPVKLFW